MNPFEKIFNYQLLTRLEDTGTFVVTAHERSWLKTMLEHPEANEAFTANTLLKLKQMLSTDIFMDTSEYLIEKARSQEKHVYHPLLRPLRRLISDRKGMKISFIVKDGRKNVEQRGFPYKLEYSMVKREWYLLWFHMRHRAFMSTKIDQITSFSEQPISPETAEQILEKLSLIQHARKTEVYIEVVRDYNQELSRIMYAFSCFEKAVDYDEEQDKYHVRIRLLRDEYEFLLSKIRFLGKRVRVIKGDYLKKRMLEASTKTLARYGIEAMQPEPIES
ncbi:WYL domain-containing protein [Paenibacillus agilis]|uniref:WYL domain-containing protein n=1 Tax=Paenibacillus agilis TaxID=3020863 RepID=A0A559J479_9BACL|nr:WYL domain-containing protein [Paenibacillus agilis]TVX94694.1 WYL domain-containing protein [Paenibacillus agilis]